MASFHYGGRLNRMKGIFYYTAGGRVFKAAAFAAISFCAVQAGAAPVELIYRYYCASCHGLEGKGDGPNATKTQPVTPRDHTSAADMSKLSDKEIIEAIRHGGAATDISRMMPPFEKTLSDKEIYDLKDYLRRLCRCRGR